MPETSTKPYLLRAIYEWCTDNGFTPYIAVMVDHRTQVPMQFVKNGEIVLNVSFDATSSLKMDNDLIQFSARFGGVSRDILIPVDNVIAIYARENGQGMAFEVAKSVTTDASLPAESVPLSTVTSSPTEPEAGKPDGTPDDNGTPPKKGSRPTLTRIK